MKVADDCRDLGSLWAAGYSIAELWGHAASVRRRTSEVDGDHPILWGILSIAEYQIDHGAGHNYLRERLATGDWVAIGYSVPKSEASCLVIVPRIPDAKFGKKQSAIGRDSVEFVDLRVVHARYLDPAWRLKNEVGLDR
jgi:hypothetical protein